MKNKITLILIFCLVFISSCKDEKKESVEKANEEREAELKAWSDSYHKYKNERPLVLISAKYGIPLENVKK